MITRLELTNFRRHRHSIIDVDASARLILIEGGNGTGKSTVVEAILWALYGEGRDGRANLDALVRRGGEDEGMQVALTFTRGERTYVATRGRRRGHSTAALTLDGAVVAALPSSVTAEVTTLLGVDAAGFRLATYAQQKELDALASLQPARRGQMLARLLGVDAVTAARGDATADARAARAALSALGAGDDLSELEARVAGARAEHDQYEAAVAELDGELRTVTERLAVLTPGEAAWQEQRRQRLVAIGAADQLQTRSRQLRQRLDTLGDATGTAPDPQVAADADRLSALEAEQVSVRDRLEVARRDADLVGRRQQLHHEADTLHRELGDLILRADRARAAAERLPAARAHNQKLCGMLRERETELAEVRDTLSAAQARLADAEASCGRAAHVGDQCDTCGQPVDDDIRGQLHQQRLAVTSELRQETAALTARLDELTGEVGRLRHDLAAAEAAVRTDQTSADQLDDLTEREASTLQRRQHLEAQIERLPSHADDPQPLLAQLAGLDERIRAARSHRDLRQAQAQAETLRRDLTTELTQVETELAELEGQDLDPDLEAAHLEHRDLSAAQSQLADRRNRSAQAQAVAGERLAGAVAALDGAAERAARRRRLEREAQQATAAAAVLDDVAERLTTRIRPALEAEVSQMLDRLSEGRYSAVRLDDNYDLWVHDDGGLQPLASLSGGEIDLVALAVRLALATVVADRTSTQGSEFLILDECFGSQDGGRQRAIVAALRQLDGMYQQVFIISHVPGVRDDVDRVIEVASEVEDGVRTATVL